MTTQVQYSLSGMTTFEGPEDTRLKSGQLKAAGRIIARWRESTTGGPTYCEFNTTEDQDAFGIWARQFHASQSMFGSCHRVEDAEGIEEHQIISKTIDALIELTAFRKNARRLTQDFTLVTHLRPVKPGLGSGRTFVTPGVYYGPAEVAEMRQRTTVPEGFELVVLNEVVGQAILSDEDAAKRRADYLEEIRFKRLSQLCPTQTVLILLNDEGREVQAIIDRAYQPAHEARILRDYGDKLVEIYNKRFH